MSINRVLLVDDQHEARQVLRAALATLPYKVEIVDVPSGEEAMLIVTTQSFELLVMDVRLAGISGLELMPVIRQRKPGMKIVLVSGTTDSSLREKIALAGADAYFYKPIEIPEFLNTIQNLLSETGFREQFPRSESPQSELEDNSLLDQSAQTENRTETVIRSESFSPIFQEWFDKSGLIGMALVDRAGNLMAQAGEPPSQAFVSGLGQVAEQIRQDSKDLLDTEMPADDFEYGGWIFTPQAVLWQVVSEGVFLVGLAEKAFLDTNPRGLANFRLAAHRFAEFLKDYEQNSLVSESLDDAAKKSPERPPESEDVLGEIDQLISSASIQDFPDVNAFWDDALSRVDEMNTNPNGLSYDQASKLGLTPDDES